MMWVVPIVQTDGWVVPQVHVIDEHFGEASSNGSSVSGSSSPRTPTRAMNIRCTKQRIERCTPTEHSQCRALQQQLDRGSLAANVSTVGTQACRKRPSLRANGRARVDPPCVADVGASECPFRDERRRCRNCSTSFFADAATEHGVATALGVASFCSNDCLWSFSLRAEDDF